MSITITITTNDKLKDSILALLGTEFKLDIEEIITDYYTQGVITGIRRETISAYITKRRQE